MTKANIGLSKQALRPLSVSLIISIVFCLLAQGSAAGSLTQAARLSKQAKELWNSGEYSEALPVYEEALRICTRAVGENDPNTAMALGNLARCHLTLGDAKKALPLFERALQILEQEPGPGKIDLSLGLHNIGGCYYLLGDSEKGLAYLERALKIREKTLGPQHAFTLMTLSSVATCVWSAGDYSRALPMFKRVLAGYEAELGANHLTTSTAMGDVARCYAGLKMHDEAVALYERALDIHKQVLGSDHPSVSLRLNDVAGGYTALGDYAKALPAAVSALKMQERSFGAQHPSTTLTIDNLAEICYRSDDLSGARSYAEQACAAKQSQLESVLNLDERTRLSWQKDRLTFWYACILPSEALAAVVLRWKGVVLDSLVEDRALEVVGRQNSDVVNQVEKMAERRQKLSKVAFEKGKENEVARLENELASLQRQLTATLYGDHRERVRGDISMQDIAPVLASGSTLIDLIRFNDPKLESDEALCYGAIITGADGTPTFVRIAAGASLDRAIDALRGAINQNNGDEVEKHTKFLSENLWQPIASRLPKGTKGLFVSPDAKLNFLSFGTLLESDGGFVAEKYPITYIGSGRDLVRKPTGETAKQLVVFADPVFDTLGQVSQTKDAVAMRSVEADVFGAINLPPLPGTKAEAEQLEVIAAGAGWDIKTTTGDEATESSVREAKKPGVLHLATHGFYLNSFSPPAEEGTRGMSVVGLNSQEDKKQNENGVDPMRASGVALTGAQQTLKLWSQRKAPDPETDGILTAEEVASLDLNATWLVTLSACETGVGEARSGEGVFGLRRAFMMAGAENLLMTLWPVADDTTANIMADFYKEALATGDAPGSLAKVQRDWLVKLREEKGLAAAIREAGPFAMVMMTAPTHPPVELPPIAKLETKDQPASEPTTQPASESVSEKKSGWWPF